MKIRKRDGRIKDYDPIKIKNALKQCFKQNNLEFDLRVFQIIVETLENKKKDIVDVEDIQDLVVEKLGLFYPILAKSYQEYREERASIRDLNENKDFYNSIEDIVNNIDNDITKENANKNAKAINTKQDLIKGLTSRRFMQKKVLDPEVVRLHNKGIIHIHDTDYRAFKGITNCCIFNLEDMLAKGTVINEKKIETPKSLRTATTVATQIVMGIGNNQYGGITMSLAHLAPYVEKSRIRYFEKNKNRLDNTPWRKFLKKTGLYNLWYSLKSNKEGFNKKLTRYTEEDTNKEIQDSMQTLQYQLNSMTANSGQSPFITVWMDINEKPEYIKETSLLIEALLKQRIKGMLSETGHVISPAFPKLIYVTAENNIHSDSEYYYLTKLAAKCSSKRLTPDYVSSKVMLDIKDGMLTPAMGCVEESEVVTYKRRNTIFSSSIKRFWETASSSNKIEEQESKGSYYMNLKDVEILDRGKFVKCNRIIKNLNTEGYLEITFSNGRSITCTTDHPLPINGKRVFAKDVKIGDIAEKSNYPLCTNLTPSEESRLTEAWLLGTILCDGCYDNQFSVTFDTKTEQDIISKYVESLKVFGYSEKDIKVINWDRAEKGVYTEIRVPNNSIKNNIPTILNDIFGGKKKVDRMIPFSIFNAPLDIRLSFLAGMIDADGYINDTNKNFSVIQLGSINKELSIQTMYLLESCGFIDVKLYKNLYKKGSDNIRYRVEAKIPNKELLKYLSSGKKIAKIKDYTPKNKYDNDTLKVTKIEFKEHDLAYTYDVTTESDKFDVSGISSHNCRSFVSPYRDDKGNAKTWGRFNIGVMTLNLPYIALESKTLKSFKKNLDKYLDILKKEQLKVAKDIANTSTEVAPMLWNYGAFARLPKGEKIGDLVYNGYATVSIGYAGIAETVEALGKDYSTEEGHKLGLEIVKYMDDYCKKAKEETNLGFSLYGTPLESTTYKFAKAIKKFPTIPKVNDRDYITNSYHVPVWRKINAFDKLLFEAPFQEYSAGGCISYIEVPDITKNIEAVIKIIQFIHENIMYAEINTSNNDVCYSCGFQGEIENIGVNEYKCPQCNNTNRDNMSIVKRVCGYIGASTYNVGREKEIHDRVKHL